MMLRTSRRTRPPASRRPNHVDLTRSKTRCFATPRTLSKVRGGAVRSHDYPRQASWRFTLRYGEKARTFGSLANKPAVLRVGVTLTAKAKALFNT